MSISYEFDNAKNIVYVPISGLLTTLEIFRIKKTVKVLVIFLVVVFVSACANFQPEPFETGKTTPHPYGALKILLDRPLQLNELNNLTHEGEVNEKKGYRVLQSVLNDLRRRFKYVSDIQQFGTSEYWALPQESLKGESIVGDCDEFALFAWAELKKRGIRSRLVENVTEDGVRHVVTEVDGWILDNRYVFVRSRRNLNYEWIKISGYNLKQNWKKIVSRSI